jgi:D-tyrosyl-tRNA(Tyr) deacylase
VRAVIQRVSQASVDVNGECVGSIGAGLVILLGVTHDDTESDAEYLSAKATNLRVFEDAGGKMNSSLLETGGGVLVVSQFTLYGDCRKGRRPSFDSAAPPEQARRLYEYFVECLKKNQCRVATGVFQAKMRVSLTNEGPVTFILDSNREK